MLRYNPPFETALDAAGVTLSGAKLYFYTTGTTTPAATYSNTGLSVANANPVVADAGGRFSDIFLNPSVIYKAVLKTSADVIVWTADPINSAALATADLAGLVKAASLSSNGADLQAIMDKLAGTVTAASISNTISDQQAITDKLDFLQTGTGAVTRSLGAKLRDVVSIKDFGALGDGTTNDTTAFVTALTAVGAAGGGALYVPAGRYKLVCPANNYISLISVEGITVAGAGDGATELEIYTTSTYGEVLRVSSDNFSWRDMTIRAKNDHTLVCAGIECDGNENVSFQNLSLVKDAASTADYLPFKMLGTGVLTGLEFDSCLFDGTSYAIWSANTHTGVTYATRISNCEFRALTGDAIALNHPSGTGAWHDITIDDCMFRDFAGASYASGLGISIARCAEVMISGCVWEGYPYDAIHIEDQSRLITITGCSFGKSGYTQYAAITIMGVSEQITIEGCHFDTHADPVARTTPCILITDGGVMASGASGTATDVVITGCHFDLHVHACTSVTATGYGEFTFSNNRVYGSGVYDPSNGGITVCNAIGLDIHDQYNMVVSGNKFAKLKDAIKGVHATTTGGMYSQIIGNQFYQCEDALELQSPQHLLISNNMMRACGRPWAISQGGTASAAGCMMTNNYAVGCYQAGSIGGTWATDKRFFFGNVDDAASLSDRTYPASYAGINHTPIFANGVQFSSVFITPGAGDAGTVRWNSGTTKLQVWSGVAWVDLH